MNQKQLFLINNACFQANAPLQVQGIMVHSTGANNPNLRRYVGPDDGALGHNPNNNHWNQPYPDGRSVCVHAFIGKLAGGDIATYQTLPWDMRGWHSGGSANNTHVGFEICEDDLSDSAYFNQVYHEAVSLCVHLCKEFSLDPLSDGVLIDHAEGHLRGIASNHKDVEHWFPRHGKNMGIFRNDVQIMVMKSESEEITDETVENEDVAIDDVKSVKWYVRLLNIFKKLIQSLRGV